MKGCAQLITLKCTCSESFDPLRRAPFPYIFRLLLLNAPRGYSNTEVQTPGRAMAAHDLANQKSSSQLIVAWSVMHPDWLTRSNSGYAGVTHLHKNCPQNSWIYPRVKRPLWRQNIGKVLQFLPFFGPWPGGKSNILFFAEGTVRNIFGDQRNMEWNFWEQGNSVKTNFGNTWICFWGTREQL